MRFFCYSSAMIGIDEVGRGAWAGPLLVVAARKNKTLPYSLTDSKLLSKKKRLVLVTDIKQTCDIGEGWVTPEEIDKLGLARAMRLAVKRSLIAIKANQDEEIIMDGSVNYCDVVFANVVCKPKADVTDPIVSAASIIAKVLRDEYMIDISKTYPKYHFDRHVGYGTKLHMTALADYGPSTIHRFSFKPVQGYANTQ